MTTNKKPPTAPDLSAAAVNIGAELLGQIRDELNTLKDSKTPAQSVWGAMTEVQQDEVLDRCRRRIEHILEVGYIEILSNGVPAVQCKLSKVVFGGTRGVVTAGLEISSSSKYRHELADAAEQQILLIIPEDLAAYTASMAEILPDADQAELPLSAGEDDPRTTEELVSAASVLSVQINERDAAEDCETWNRDHLVDYIQYAEKVLDEATKSPASGV